MRSLFFLYLDVSFITNYFKKQSTMVFFCYLCYLKKKGVRKTTSITIEDWIQQWSSLSNTFAFPVFDLDHYVDFYQLYPLFYLAPHTILHKQVSILQIYGNNWVFEAKETRGAYPRLHKLDRIIRGFCQKKEIPPIPLAGIMGFYYLEEGNHRLYASKWLGKSVIEAEVVAYNYPAFLRRLRLISHSVDHYVEYNDQCYEVSIEEFLGLSTWKQQYTKQ